MFLLHLYGVGQELPVDSVVAFVDMLWVGQVHVSADQFGRNPT